MLDNIHIERIGIFKDLSLVFLSLMPAAFVVLFIIMLGSGVYIPVSAVVVNYYFSFGVGWLSSPVVGLSAGLGPLALLSLLVFIAVQSSLFLTVNYDLLEEVPHFGKFVKNIRKKAEEMIEKHELIENISYLGMYWLMFLPLYGTGPMTMSIVGRILSLEWWKVWITISLSAATRYSIVIVVVYYGFL